MKVIITIIILRLVVIIMIMDPEAVPPGHLRAGGDLGGSCRICELNNVNTYVLFEHYIYNIYYKLYYYH